MDVMSYTGKFDEASWQLLAMAGLTRARFEREGAGMAAVEQHTRYQRELHAGDVVSIHSTVLEIRDKSIRMRHELQNNVTGEIAAFTEITAVYIDAAVRKARSLPGDARERMRRLLSDGHDTVSMDSMRVVLEECC